MFRRKIPSPFGPGAALPCKAEDRCCPAFNLDIFGEFSFFEKEPTLQKEKSQNPDLPESPFTEAILKARFRLIFLENPFFHPLGKLMKPGFPALITLCKIFYTDLE